MKVRKPIEERRDHENDLRKDQALDRFTIVLASLLLVFILKIPTLFLMSSRLEPPGAEPMLGPRAAIQAEVRLEGRGRL